MLANALIGVRAVWIRAVDNGACLQSHGLIWQKQYDLQWRIGILSVVVPGLRFCQGILERIDAVRNPLCTAQSIKSCEK